MRVLLVLSLLTLPLAGCVSSDGQMDELPPQDAYRLTVSDLPSEVLTGETFTFTLLVEGPEGFESDHIGGHFGPTSHATGSITNYPAGCIHQEAALPGSFTVTCEADASDTLFIRGHVRITSGAAQVDFWSEEATVEVSRPSYDLVLVDPPTHAVAGEEVTLQLAIDGPQGFESDHIGAHFGPQAQEEPSVPAYPGTCQHQAGALPDTFQVTCVFHENGTIHLRGHMRLVHGQAQVDHWTEEHAIAVEAGGA